jgi:formylglycine-generating enzyme required for sulfatase activity
MSKGQRRAILIASSRFPEEKSLEALRCPENDVDGVREILEAKEFGAFDEILTIKNERSHEALVKINRALREADADDLTLIYYSGHGKTDRHAELYLATVDTQLKVLESTSIPFDRIYSFIRNSDCKSIALILDCCYSGAAANSIVKGSVDEKLESASKGSGVYILTASSAFQTAQEGKDDQHSLLTKHILEGIRLGDADVNQDGKVSMDDLFRYVEKHVRAEGKQEPMRWDVSVRGSELIISWAGKAKAAKLKQIEEMLIEMRSDMPARVRLKAYQVLLEGQSEKGGQSPHLKLLEDLFDKRLNKGDFLDEWDQIEASQLKQAPPLPPTVPSQQEKKTTPPQQEKKAQSPPPPELAPPQEKKSPPRKQVQSFTDDLNGVPLEMIYVPGGSFKMGSPKGKGYYVESPQHDVTVPGFYIGKYQITQAQWEAVMGKNPSHFKGDPTLPVEKVSWNDGKQFCEKIAQITGKAYRLPSEAEWEYACRAGTTGDYAGDLDAMAWDGKNSNKTHPVGQKQPNAFGLYEMYGNVLEWCEDVWHDSYKDAPTDGSAWLSGGDSSYRVVRGCSWGDDEDNCRSAFRDRLEPGLFDNFLGVRVVVSARTLTS